MNTQTEENPAVALQEETAIEIIRRQLDLRILTRARVVIIGLGGIGLFLSRAVVTFMAGLLTALEPDEELNLLLVDGKVFSERHKYRCAIPKCDNKAVAVAAEFLERYEYPGLNIRYTPEFVTAENINDVIQDGDCVLMGVDNHATRNLVSRHCASGKLNDVVLISGGNDGVEDGLRGSYGNVQVYVREEGVNQTAPLHSVFHPEIADPADVSPGGPGCDESGVPQLTFTNMFAASLMAAALLRLMTPNEGQHERPYDEVAFDIVEGVAQPHWLSGPKHPK